MKLILLALLAFAVLLPVFPCCAKAEEYTEIRSVKTEAFEMEYFTFGSGPKPFVILPGLSLKSVMLSADAVASSYACFAEEYTAYVFDVRKNLPEDYSISDMADDTAAAMRKLNIADAYVFGCSMGGAAAQYIAIRCPELVHKLALGSSFARPNETSTATIRQWRSLAESGDVRTLNRAGAQMVYSPDYFGQFREIFASLENEGTPEELERFAVMAGACEGFDIFDSLDRIGCPVLVIGSWQDRVVSGEASVEIARKLRCDLYMYSGYGHAVYDEAPDYKARLMDFFSDGE